LSHSASPCRANLKDKALTWHTGLGNKLHLYLIQIKMGTTSMYLFDFFLTNFLENGTNKLSQFRWDVFFYILLTLPPTTNIDIVLYYLFIPSHISLLILPTSLWGICFDYYFFLDT
jgi:hypothetical protein